MTRLIHLSDCLCEVGYILSSGGETRIGFRNVKFSDRRTGSFVYRVDKSGPQIPTGVSNGSLVRITGVLETVLRGNVPAFKVKSIDSIINAE